MARLLIIFSIFFATFAQAQAPYHFPTVKVQGPPWQYMTIFHKQLDEEQLQTECRGVKLQDKRRVHYNGCAAISFSLQECHFVWLKGMKEAFEHEKKHCEGFDHVDAQKSEIDLSSAWKSYRSDVSQRVQDITLSGISTEQAFEMVNDQYRQAEIHFLSKNKWPVEEKAAKKLGWDVINPKK